MRMTAAAQIFAILFLFGFIAAGAHAAGIKEFDVPADSRGPKIHAVMWTPCATAPSDIHIETEGRLDIDTKGALSVVPGVKDCPIQGHQLPLIVMSHGLYGVATSHHDTAEVLADSGFVVVALDHALDSGLDPSRPDDISAFIERPTDVSRLIDYVLKSSSAKIDRRDIGFFGFSRGGYTGLVLAGATPDFRHAHFYQTSCNEVHSGMCGQIRNNEFPAHLPGYDARIKALVIADPLSFFPTQGSLRQVTVPIQLWSSELGGDGVLPEDVAALVRDLPRRPDFRRVPNSVHFSFLVPCSTMLASVARAICTDPVGFDRTTFHREFDAQVLAYFRKHLR
jgi:predicted dienelactone hydrolase